MNRKSFLQFGDLFIIQGYCNTEQYGQINGYLSAVGYTDHRVFFQSVEINDSNDIPLAGYIKNLIFQVWPKLNYDAHKDYRKFIRIQNAKYKVANDISTTKDNAVLIEENQLSERKQEEASYNSKALHSVMGQYVFYGAEVQLKHIDSQSFLNGKILTSEIDKSAYTFELSEDYSAGMIFKIMPKYKLRKVGEPVQFNDIILIQNIKLSSFISFAHDLPIDIDQPLDYNDDSKMQLPEVCPLDQTSLRFESCLNQFIDTSWELLYHGDTEGKSIRGNQLIRLKHTELESYLASESYEVYLRKYEGTLETEVKSVDSIWEVNLNQPFQKGEKCVVEKKNQIFLRHLLTGKLMSFSERDGRMILTIEHQEDENQTERYGINFIPTTKQKIETIEHSECFNIQMNQMFCKAMSIRSQHDSLVNQPFFYRNEKKEQIPQFYEQLNEGEDEITRRALELVQKKSEKDAFWIETVPLDESQDVLFVLSAIPTLKRLAHIFRSMSTQLLTEPFLYRVQETLINLINFIVTIQSIDEDPLSCDGYCNTQRQKIIKQCKLLDILTDILYQPFDRGIYSAQSMKDIPEKIIYIFQLSYRVIQFSIKEYRANEVYMSQWLDLIMAQAMYDDQEYDIMAGQTLTELIDNNKLVLETKIKYEIIQNFVNELIKSNNPKYQNLLRALVNCNGTAMVGNQMHISNQLLQADVLKQILVPIKLANGDVMVTLQGDSYQLNTLKNEMLNINSPQSFDYFIGQIELFADLCLDQNYIAINKLKDVYTIEIFNEIISGDVYVPQIKTPFAKLFINLWIHGISLQKLLIPNYVRDIKQFENMSGINQLFPYQQQDVQQFGFLKKYVEEYMKDQTNMMFQQLHKKYKNHFTETILQIIENFVEYGLYQDAKELQNIIIPILAYLNGGLDTKSDQESHFRQRQIQQSGQKIVQDVRAVQRKRRTVKLSTTQKKEEKIFIESRYQINDYSKVLMKNRCLCCTILLKIQLLLYDIRATYVLYKCYRESEMNQREKENSIDQNDYDRRRLISPNIEQQQQQLKSNTNANKQSQNKTLIKLRPQINIQLVMTQLEFGLNQFRELYLADIAPINLNAVLMDLLMYDDDQLIQLAFTMFYNNYKRQQILCTYLNKIQIIETENQMAVYNKSKELHLKLKGLIVESENWWGCAIEPFQQLSSILSQLILMLTNNKYEDELLNETYLDSELLKDCINPTYQKLMVNLFIHETVIELLEYDVQTNKEHEIDPTPLLVLCYKFLACIAFNYPDNQDLLSHHIDVYKQHLEMNQGALSSLLLQELFRDNRKILMDSKNVENIIIGLLKIMEQLQNSNKIKILLLLSLKVYMSINNHSYRPNQIIVVTSLLSQQFSNIKINFDTQLDIYTNCCKTFTQTLNQALSQPSQLTQVQLPPFIQYFDALLHIMSVASENKNAAAESKSQNYLSANQIKTLLERSYYCWNVKYSLADFFFNVYLETEKTSEEDIQIIVSILTIFYADLQYIIKNHLLLSHCQVQIADLRGHKQLISEIELYLLDGILISFQQIIKSNLITQKPFIKDIIKSVIELSNITINQNVLQRISSLLRELIHNKKLAKDIDYKTDFEPLVPNTLQNMIKNTKVTSAKMPKMATFISRAEFQIEEMLFSQEIGQAIQETLNSHEFSVKVDQEFEHIIETLLSIETITDQAFLSINTLSFNQILTRMIKIVDPINKLLSSDLTIMALKIFRKVVEMQVPDTTVSSSEWQFEDFEPYSKKIIQRQQQLIDIGLIQVLRKLLVPESSLELKREVILVSISLLVGGNENSQMAFYNQFLRDTKNMFLLEVRSIVEEGFSILKRSMAEINRTRDYLYNEGLLDDKMERLFSMRMNSSALLQDEQEEFLPQTSDQYDQFILNTIIEVYRFLQLLCEGHNQTLQDYLREQVQNSVLNGKSVNLLQFSLSRLSTIQKLINLELTPVASQVLDFLIEACQGPCIANQISLLQSKVVDFSRDLMSTFSNPASYIRRGFKTQTELQQCTNLLSKITKMLLSLMEGTKDSSVFLSLQENLDLQFIRVKLGEQYQRWITESLKLPVTCSVSQVNNYLYSKVTYFDNEIIESFNMYILLATLADQGKNNIAELILKQQSDSQMENKAMEFFKSNTQSIEVFFRDSLFKIYFPMQPTCHNLSKSSRTKLMSTVKRDSPNDKINGLIDVSSIFFTEMEHMSWLSTLPIQFTSKRFDILKDFSTFISALINIVMIFSLELALKSPDEPHTYMNKKAFLGVQYDTWISIFSILQLITSFLMLFFWLIINTPVCINANWKDYADPKNIDETMEANIDQCNNEPNLLTTQEVLYLFRTRGPFSLIFKTKGGLSNFGSLWTKMIYYSKCLIFVVMDNQFLYLLLYICLSIIGAFYDPIVYTLHLLDFINRFEMLKNVIRSVTDNWTQVLLTFILMLIVLYIYAIIGYYFLVSNFYWTQIEGGENMCHTLFACYVYMIQYGLRNGGGITESMLFLSYQGENRVVYWIRFIYDISFFSIITVMFINILFGIIIDTFSGLRYDKQAMEEDMKYICFICGLDRWTFDKMADGFENHIRRDHYLWNYLYYIHYLEHKDQTDLNGLESYVVDKLKSHEISWLPIMKAISLRQMDSEENNLPDLIQQKLKVINSKIENIEKLNEK